MARNIREMTCDSEKPNASPPDDIDHVATREGYDRWAAIYDDEQNPLVTIEQPQVDALLGDVRGLHVADIGCGTGRHTVRLLQHGAHVTAVDFSDQMLARARGKVQLGRLLDCSVQFVQHDLAQRLPFADHVFDRVICGLVVDHIADLSRLFVEMKRVCVPTGFIVVSTMHPALMLKGVQARFVDPNTGRETRPQSCPHQISDYVMAASDAGLKFEHCSEHIVDQELAQRCPRAVKYIGWPILLMMKLSTQ
jgi:ubiquinone/menaquinone biosynthesis C-methylase UbiE